MTLGERIKEARGVLTQDELAIRVRSRRPKLKVTGVRISRYERDVQSPRLSVLVAIAEATDKNLDFFRVSDDTETANGNSEDEEDDSAVLNRAAFHLDRGGEYALADALRAKARKAAMKTARSAYESNAPAASPPGHTTGALTNGA